MTKKIVLAVYFNVALILAMAQNVGIGTASPLSKLHVVGDQTLDGSLQFVNPLIGAPSMINMFNNGNLNSNRMIIAHSPLFQNWGLRYKDSTDQFDFMGNGVSVLNVDLGFRNVGIGTSTPLTKLHVVNGSFGGGPANGNSNFILENNTHNYISILSPAASERGIIFGDNLNVNDGGIIYDGSNNTMFFRTQGNINRMSLSSVGTLSVGGNIDIGGPMISFGSNESFSDAGANQINTNSDFFPYIDNSHTLGSSTFRWNSLWAADGTINTSDARDKTNIRDLDYGIKEIMKLRSTRFNWKNDEENGEKLGLLAQDLKKILPEVVRDWEYQTDESGVRIKIPSARLGVMYADIIPVLIRGMQEQQTSIEAKDKKIEELQLQIKEIQNLLVAKGLMKVTDIKVK